MKSIEALKLNLEKIRQDVDYAWNNGLPMSEIDHLEAAEQRAYEALQLAIAD